MTSKKQGRVFISHSSIDYPEALEICRKIEERGVRCAIAPRDIPLGANYASWIGETINNATAFIVVISHSSIKSKPVLSELEEAFNGNGLPIYPVRIDPIQRAGLPFDIRFFIGVRQMIDAIRPLRADALDRLSKSIAREVLGQGGSTRKDAAALTGEQARFQALWARMDERRSTLAWLWEAALGGPLWLFHRGMDRLGALMVALLAVLVLAIGLAGDVESAALVLILGWLGLCLYLGVIGATLLRRHVGDRVERIVAQGGGAVGPAMLSLAALVGALGAGALAGGPGRPIQQTGSVEAGPVRKANGAPPGPPAFVAPNTTLARTQGNAADYREKAAQEERERAAALVGAVVGYGAGLQDAQHDAAAVEAAQAEHAAQEVQHAEGATQ